MSESCQSAYGKENCLGGKGVTVKEANYDDVEQMTKAFEGADRLFFISSIINGPKRVEQHRKVIEACKKAGVKHITYTSFFGADREGYNQYVLPDHRATRTKPFKHR